MRADRSEIVWHGLIVGLLGYATVALSVSAIDLLLGRSVFFTVALLGEWLFYGLRDPARITVWPGAVFAYNGLHFITFLSLGLLASWLASISERGPLYWYGALVMYLFVLVHLFAAVQLMTEPLRTLIPSYEVWLPSIAAAVVMTAYLLRMHPQLRHELSEWVDEDDVAEARSR